MIATLTVISVVADGATIRNNRDSRCRPLEWRMEATDGTVTVTWSTVTYTPPAPGTTVSLTLEPHVGSPS